MRSGPAAPGGVGSLDPDVPELATARLRLSRPRGGDAEAIERLAGDWEVARWLARVPHPYGREDALFFIAHVVSTEPCWAIRDRDGGALMGVVGLTPAAGGPELGYWLGRPFWGRGVATEAARAVLDHIFAATGPATIRSGFFADNARSAHVLDKLGFDRVGQSGRWSVARGETLPHVAVALTRDRWRQARPPGQNG